MIIYRPHQYVFKKPTFRFTEKNWVFLFSFPFRFQLSSLKRKLKHLYAAYTLHIKKIPTNVNGITGLLSAGITRECINTHSYLKASTLSVHKQNLVPGHFCCKLRWTGALGTRSPLEQTLTVSPHEHILQGTQTLY